MKIALVHDELVRRGGAEQFTLILHKAFPDAPIYTSCYNSKFTYDEFKTCDIRPTWISKYLNNEKKLKRFFYPFVVWAMKRVDLSEYDVVLISTTTCAKYVKTNPNNLFIAFCHFPFRLAFFPEYYNEVMGAKGVKKKLYSLVINRLKTIDFNAAKKIEHFITNTPHIGEIIKKSYELNKDIAVIPSSIQCSQYYVAKEPTLDYYLVVSRLEAYKKNELVIQAFNEMPHQKLIIVGRGSNKEACRRLAKPNIEFKEGLSASQIADLYANCKALIFPQEEDFGLTPIEANASGRPVIAYGKGGITYTTIPYVKEGSKSTSYFFKNQTKEDIISAIEKCEKIEFDPVFIRQHAEKFDESQFITKIREYVLQKYNEKSDSKI